jgi:hypothetical protein
MTAALTASLLLPSGAYAANTAKPFTDSTTAQKYAYEEVMDLSPSFHFTASLPGHDQYQYIDRYTSLCRSLYQLDNGKSGYRGDFAAYSLYHQDTVSYLQIKRGRSWYCYVEDSICYTVTQSQQQKYRKRKKALLKSLHLSKDKTEKAQYKNVRKIYRWITGHVKYDYAKSKTSAYDALILKKATCNGYAALFYDLCRDSGIPCRIIIGHTDTSRDSLHAWNIVRIGKKWYNCDPTWDAGSIFQPYFLSGSRHFSEEHLPWKRYRTKSFKKHFPVSRHNYDPDAL